MELLILWITTIVLTFFIDIKSAFIILKDVADAGYKFKIENLKNLNLEIDENYTKLNRMCRFIPLLNLIESMRRVILYNNNRYNVLSSLSILDTIEEMTEYEKKEYKKKPTGLNAIIVPIKTQIKIEQAIKLKIDNSEIFYEYDENNNINILKVDGPLSFSSNEKIIEIINKDKDKLVECVLKLFGTPEEFINSLTEDRKAEINISEEKEKLIELKNEIIESIDKEEKGPILTKRKDKLD